MAYTFGADDILAALGLTAGLAVQESGGNKTTQNAVVVDANGNEITATNQAFDVKTEKTITFKASGTVTAIAAGVKLGGAGTSGVVLTTLSVSRVHNDHPTVSCTAHSHTGDAADHLTGVSNQNEWTLPEIDLSFGVPTPLADSVDDDCQSQTVAYAVQHRDRLNKTGSHLIGNSFGLRKDVTEEYVYSGSDPATPTGYIEDSVAPRSPNTDFKTATIAFHSFAV